MTYLNVNTTHLERKVLKASFGELFRNQSYVERNHGEVFGTPVIDNGATLNGTTDYIQHALQGHEFNSANISLLISFWPTTPTDEDAARFLISTELSDYSVRKRSNSSNNVLRIELGSTLVANVPEGTYSPFWDVGGRNILVVSGTDGDTDVWLISSLGIGHILNSAGIAWSPRGMDDLFIGANTSGLSLFSGKIDSVKIFKSLLTEQDVINYFNNTTEILPPPVIYFPMFSGDHVPSSRTLDISNNGYDADFGSGAAEPVKSVTRGYRVDNGDRFAIDEPALGIQVVSISLRIKDITIDSAGSYLWDARRTGGTGYCYIDTGGNLVLSSGTPYVNGRQTNVVELYDSVITLTGHSIDVTEGLDLCVRNDYAATLDLNADVLEFEMSPETLTHVQVAKIYERMTRRVPSQQASLCSETTPAERALGASFGCLFANQLRVEALGGTVYGTPVIDNGATLNGTTDYIKYDLLGHEFDSATISIIIEFYPDFEADDDVSHFLIEGDLSVLELIKFSNNSLLFGIGGTNNVLLCSLANYQPYWKVGERNVFQITVTSGNNHLYLNGVELTVSSNTTAWSPTEITTLSLGARNTGTGFSGGTFFCLKVFKSLLTLQDAINFYDNSTYTYRKEAVLDLPMRATQDDPGNVRTLDVSGHGNHAQFGDGVTPSTYPTKLLSHRGYGCDGTQYFTAGFIPAATKVSFGCLVQLDDLSTTRYIASFTAAGGASINFLCLATTTDLRFYAGGGSSANAARFVHGGTGLYSIVGVADGSMTKIYVNGKEGIKAVTPLVPVVAANQFLVLGINSILSQAVVGSMFSAAKFDFCLTPLQAADLDIRMRIGQQLT